MYVYERKSSKSKSLLYSGFAVLFLFVGALFIYRNNLSEVLPVSTETQTTEHLQLPSIEIQEKIGLPYKINASTLTHFFDLSKSDELLNKAVIEFEGVYRPSQGVDYGYDGKVFEVIAMISGEVVDIKEDSLMGKSVTVKNGNVELTYQSLSSVLVNKGQIIQQSDLLGLAGENLYNQSLGIHLHVVAEVDGKLVDPALLIGRELNEIQGH